jgi:hypothetical protein
MPIDLDAAAVARKRNGQSQTQNLITMGLLWVIICLGILVLLFQVGLNSS